MIIAGIIVCEIAFWVFLLAGLAVRYLLRRRVLSRYVLLGSPLADLGLLVLAAIDLARGATATEAHALAAAYISFTVVFGSSIIGWADVRFAHRFADGPAPTKVPKRGRGRVRHEWHEFGKAVLACAIASALIGLGVLMVGDTDRTRALVGFEAHLGIVLVIWLIAGPLWETVSGLRTCPRPVHSPASPPSSPIGSGAGPSPEAEGSTPSGHVVTRPHRSLS